ncbi:L-rhamnose mutarotase [Acidiphilium sp.]|uniref:L-rhamnose mutarotase n=1 Tax=Acidiphilium sp. TaxID=527 RepID=UPI002587F3C9|nr:L-rhamnose mutarotase [Acidiphilium sp.]
MEQIAFRMQLDPAQAAEYERRHDEIWPELVAALKDAGISDYSIFLDPSDGSLFAVLRRHPGHAMDALPEQAVMRRWWQAMADIMRTNPDASPTASPLRRVFHLP